MGNSVGAGCPKKLHTAKNRIARGRGQFEGEGELPGQGSLHGAEVLRQGSPRWLYLMGSIQTCWVAAESRGSTSTVTATCSAHLGKSCCRHWAGWCRAGSGTCVMSRNHSHAQTSVSLADHHHHL